MSYEKSTLSTFAAFKSRNFLIYFIGYLPSVAGTFMQNASLGWLIYRLTGSNEAVSLVLACLLVPTVLCMIPAGVAADRFDRRTILMITQSVALGQSLIVWALVLSGLLTVWAAAGLCAVAGVCLAFELPARVPLVTTTVEAEHIPNALALNGLVFYGGVTIGRALAALVLAAGYVSGCFAINALSFVAELISLSALKGKFQAARETKSKTAADILEGFGYVWSRPACRRAVLMIGIFGFFGMQFQPLAANIASRLAADPAGFMAVLLAAVGAGQASGSIVLASKANKRFVAENLWLGYVILGIATALLALASGEVGTILAGTAIGFAIPLCVSGGNAVMQTHADDEWRGRATAIYFTVFLGSEPAGYLLGGLLADHDGLAAALLIGAAACLAAAIVYRWTMDKSKTAQNA